MSANDNELPMTYVWARQFCGHTDESLLAAIGVLAGLIDKPHVFEKCAAEIRKSLIENPEKAGDRPNRLVWKNLILKEVAEKHSVTISEMQGPSRVDHITWARHEACYRLREEMGLSFPRIGVIMGGRDHTTALNSYKRHKWRLDGANYVKPRGAANVSA